jgi:Winged helix DNA-binding domain
VTAPLPAFTWDRILGWRMRRHLLDPIGGLDVPATVRATCGIQAQVASAAELAVAVRREPAAPGAATRALEDRTLLRTWAMRGTLHLLAPVDAAAYLSLMGAVRTWERPAWQRTFGLSLAEIELLAEAVSEILDGRVLEREELIEEIAARSGSRDFDEHLRSGWGAVLKPLAFMGLLCNGPTRGNRVTFTSPRSWLENWTGVPEPPEAARVVIPAYLRAYGPARLETFDAWLTRGSSRKSDLRGWFQNLVDEQVLTQVDVQDEAQPFYALSEDVEELQDAAPSDALRLLPGFDQYVLGPGTRDARIIPPGQRTLVSKTAGWIAPVVVKRGRVIGTWELDGEVAAVALFPGTDKPAAAELADEAERLGACLGRELQARVT